MQSYPDYPPFAPPPYPPVPPPDYLLWLCLLSGLVGWMLPILGAVAAIYTGHMLLRQMRPYRGYYGDYYGYNMAAAGLVLGYLQLGFFLLACCAATCALSGYWRPAWPYYGGGWWW